MHYKVNIFISLAKCHLNPNLGEEIWNWLDKSNGGNSSDHCLGGGPTELPAATAIRPRTQGKKGFQWLRQGGRVGRGTENKLPSTIFPRGSLEWIKWFSFQCIRNRCVLVSTSFLMSISAHRPHLMKTSLWMYFCRGKKKEIEVAFHLYLLLNFVMRTN